MLLGAALDALALVVVASPRNRARVDGARSHVAGEHLAVALEVTKMDPESKVVEYCYVEHGDTKGTQRFSLKPTTEGFTEITQFTRYKCSSKLRGRRLYYFFHERIVNEFFNKIKSKSEAMKNASLEISDIYY